MTTFWLGIRAIGLLAVFTIWLYFTGHDVGVNDVVTMGVCIAGAAWVLTLLKVPPSQW